MGRKSNADKGKARGAKTMVIGVPTYYKRKDGRWTAEVKIKSGFDIKRKYFYGGTDHGKERKNRAER